MIRVMLMKNDKKQYVLKIAAICFWLLLWELISRVVGYEILLPSPFAVFDTLIKLSGKLDFWQSILYSSVRIILGFVLAVSVGTVLAIGSYQSILIKELIEPLMKLIKAMPVASFIILAILWIDISNLSVLISFMTVVPMIYTNVLQGLKVTDVKLLQMAKVFHLSLFKKITAIYIPAVMPFFISAISVGLGFCWKSGIAAEVIGQPAGSIGRHLYESKVYWVTKELFAWSIVIVIISVLFERLFILLLHPNQRKIIKRGIGLDEN